MVLQISYFSSNVISESIRLKYFTLVKYSWYSEETLSQNYLKTCQFHTTSDSANSQTLDITFQNESVLNVCNHAAFMSMKSALRKLL